MSIKSMLLGLVAAAAMTAGAAQADVLTFTYNGGASDFGGVLDGTLQPDNNTFVITGYQSFSVGGSPVAFVPSDAFESLDTYEGYGLGYSGDGTPTVTLDGSYMDIIVSDATSGFAIGVNDLTIPGGAAFNSGGAFGSVNTTFLPSGWSASVTMAAVPEPATLAVFGFALMGFAAMRRCKATKA